MDEQKTLHLGLVTGDPFRAESLEQILQELGWQLTACVNLPEPERRLRRQPLDLILVDLDLPSAIAQLGELVRLFPHIPVLALATPQRLIELQDALQAGATGFVAFPIEVGHFQTTVLRTVQARSLQASPQAGAAARPRGARMIAVTGLKGGVGRSTLAVNLAVALRQQTDQDVILVEAHHHLGDLSLMLNVVPRHTLASLAKEENIDLDVIEGHLQPHHSGVRLLAAPPDLSQLVSLPVESWRLILQYLRELATYVVVDTGAVADDVLSEVLTLADEILIVTGPDLASLRNALVLHNALESEANVQGRPHIVLNRAGVRGGLTEAASSAQLGERIGAEIPDDPALATFALNRGMPFVLSHPRSLLSRSVVRLAVTLAGKGAVKQASARARRRAGLPFFRRRRAVEAT